MRYPSQPLIFRTSVISEGYRQNFIQYWLELKQPHLCVMSIVNVLTVCRYVKVWLKWFDFISWHSSWFIKAKDLSCILGWIDHFYLFWMPDESWTSVCQQSWIIWLLHLNFEYLVFCMAILVIGDILSFIFKGLL